MTSPSGDEEGAMSGAEATVPAAFYRAVVRVLENIARGDYRTLGTVNEDYQQFVDEIIGKIRDGDEARTALAAARAEAKGLREALEFYAKARRDGGSLAKAISEDRHPYSAQERHEATLERARAALANGGSR